MRRPWLVLLLALVALQIPWLGRPPNFDETNFLRLAEGAAAAPWRPHDVPVNWQGVTQRAFEVLSNPPGIAWWLAPWSGAPVAVQRLAMLPWLLVALAGARRLAGRFVGDADVGAAVLLTAPIAILSTTALLPDAPLYALVLLGVGGFVDAVDRGGRAWPWALVAGSAALFRYSGVCVAPLLVLYALRRGYAPWAALVSLVPFAALGLHDLAAYDAWHFLAMTRFQSVSHTPTDLGHKAVAALAMLGGAAALPVFRWSRAHAMGAVLGALAGAPFGWPGALFGAAGGATVGAVVVRRSDAGFFLAWAGGGALFLLSLRFVATRYWLPFLPPLLLALPLGRGARWLLFTHTCLGALLLADDTLHARAVTALAEQVASLGTGRFTGHWGWQHTLEAHGWTALDEGARAEPGELVAMPVQAWPQPVDTPCTHVIWEGSARPPFPWLPRGYSQRAHVNLHADWIAGPPPERTVAPWGFANDPYERARVCRD